MEYFFVIDIFCKESDKKTFVRHNHGYRVSCIYDLEHYKKVSQTTISTRTKPEGNPKEYALTVLPNFRAQPMVACH